MLQHEQGSEMRPKQNVKTIKKIKYKLQTESEQNRTPTGSASKPSARRGGHERLAREHTSHIIQCALSINNTVQG